MQVPQWGMHPAVQALMCLRGFQLNAAAVLVAERGSKSAKKRAVIAVARKLAVRGAETVYGVVEKN